MTGPKESADRGSPPLKRRAVPSGAYFSDANRTRMSDNPCIAWNDHGFDGYLENENNAVLLSADKMAFHGTVYYDSNERPAESV